MNDCFNDPLLIQDHPCGILTPDPGFQPGKPTLLIYAPCQARPLMDYFRMKSAITDTYNLVRLETAPMVLMETKHPGLMASNAMSEVFKLADVMLCFGMPLTCHMGVFRPDMSVEKVRERLKPSCRVITVTPPVIYLPWPICEAYGYMGVIDSRDQTFTEEHIWQKFLDGTFDPKFQLRSRWEYERLKELGTFYDVDFVDFVFEHMPDQKLWWTSSHPTFNTMAYIGSQVIKSMSLPYDDESVVLGFDHALHKFEAYPETHYEWDFYKLKYPMRYTANWQEFYRNQVKIGFSTWKQT